LFVTAVGGTIAAPIDPTNADAYGSVVVCRMATTPPAAVAARCHVRAGSRA
jgi:hypothetical protein